MEWLLDPFALGFQQRALVGGVTAGVMASVVGTWLVLRGMSFFGDAFVHGVVPGIAAAVLLDFSPFVGAAIAAAVMVLGIGIIHRQTALREDTAIGLLFVGMLALGVVIISKSSSYAGSLTTILFGDALGVSRSAVVAQAALAAVVVTLCVLLYRPLLALSFDRTKAEALGMRPGLTHAALLVLIAAAVIGSYQSVGTLLVFGLLVGPPATAALLSRSVPMMMGLAVAIAVFSVWLGLVLSYHWGTAGSATMAVVPIVLFFVTLAVSRLAAWRRRRNASNADALVPEEPAAAGSSR
jgi:ABC-type Mn2+/Zn2+ transport system permease subunit